MSHDTFPDELETFTIRLFASYLGMVILTGHVKRCTFSVVIRDVGSCAMFKQDICNLFKTIKSSEM